MTEQGTKPTFRDAMLAARTAYISIPQPLTERYGEREIVERVRAHFTQLRAAGSFASEFDSTTHWRNNLAEYLAEVDCLVIACDSSRLIGTGCLREIKTAMHLQKLIVVFKVDEQAERLFFGYIKAGTPAQPIIKLRTREELRQAKARLAQEKCA